MTAAQTVIPLNRLPVPSIVHVTPEIAEQWLGKNTKNRNVTNQRVHDYARDMAAGRWQFTGDPVRFSSNGRLLDGQHRLLAIISSGATLPIVVIRDLPDETQSVMDIGRIRTAADALKLRGIPGDTKDMAAVARSVLMYTTGESHPTRAEITEYVEEYVDALADAAKVSRAASVAGLRGGSLFGTAYYLLCEVDPDASSIFMTKVITGADLGQRDPILVLRRRFLAGMPSGNRRDASSLRYNLAHIFRAWNHWRDGKELQLLRVKPTDAFPYPR